MILDLGLSPVPYNFLTSDVINFMWFFIAMIDRKLSFYSS